MTSGWEGFVHMIEHKYNKKKQAYVKTNIVNSAAIYGLDGEPWAVSANWPGLHTHEKEIEGEYGPEITMINEFEIAKFVSGGVRRPGIYLGKEKYGFVKFDQEYKSA